MVSNKSTQAEVALAMWSDLDELIVQKIVDQGNVIRRLIEYNKHLFPEVDVFSAYNGQVITMLQMFDILGMSNFYYNHNDGHFYHWEGLHNTATGAPQDRSPRVVHIIDGPELQKLVRNKDFITSIIHAMEEHSDHKES